MYPETLVSAGEEFELGFFSPRGSSDSRRYVGIWYYGTDPPIVVWVANRDDPLIGLNASFGLVDGDLQLRHEGPAIRLNNVTGSNSSTLVVKLLDTGNLVLLEDDRSKTVLWQSFDHPTDTFLPGMLMINDFKLTSWFSQEDPKQGTFTFQRDQESGSSEYKVVQDLSPYWRSGVYGDFIQADENIHEIFRLLANASLGLGYVRLVMNHTGQIQYFSLKNGTVPKQLDSSSKR